jgi:hypothetical protein
VAADGLIIEIDRCAELDADPLPDLHVEGGFRVKAGVVRGLSGLRLREDGPGREKAGKYQ